MIDERDIYLRYFNQLTKTPFLHYGYWLPEETPELCRLQQAQERYVTNLIDLVPTTVRTVLDVGCGVGGVAQILHRNNGLSVTGLTPDPIQSQRFKELTGNGMSVITSRFEDYQFNQTYDMCLMCESAQYIPIQTCFLKSRHACKGQGYLLVSDYFLLPDAVGHPLSKSGHDKAEFLAAAKKHGFILQSCRDITENVAPTLDLARSQYESVLMPTIRFVVDLISSSNGLVSALFKRKTAKHMEEFSKYSALLDSVAFRELKEYLILLFKME